MKLAIVFLHQFVRHMHSKIHKVPRLSSLELQDRCFLCIFPNHFLCDLVRPSRRSLALGLVIPFHVHIQLLQSGSPGRHQGKPDRGLNVEMQPNWPYCTSQVLQRTARRKSHQNLFCQRFPANKPESQFPRCLFRPGYKCSRQCHMHPPRMTCVTPKSHTWSTSKTTIEMDM